MELITLSNGIKKIIFFIITSLLFLSFEMMKFIRTNYLVQNFNLMKLSSIISIFDLCILTLFKQ